MTLRSKILIAWCAVVVILHVWGAVSPSHLNWGVHLFGFYPISISLVAVALLVALSLGRIQQRLLHRLEQFLRIMSKYPVWVGFILAAALLLGAVFLFPAKLHLLGDGAILLRSVFLGINSNEISASFQNQPLMFWIYRWAMSLHPVDASPNTYNVYFTIDIIAAILYLALLFWCVRKPKQPTLERFLLGCFIFFGAGSQFFFGYVENYVLQYVFTTAYCISGWFALERRVSITVPILCFVVMSMLHLGDLVFAPSFILLMLLHWRKNLKRAILIIGAAGIVGIAVLFAIGFNLVDMTRHLGSNSVDFLRPFTTEGGRFAYPMFSFYHLLDWFNSNMLVVPFGLMLSILFIYELPVERRWTNPSVLFLAAAAACGLFFTWVINSALGLARDWDLFSTFFVPLMIFPVYLLSQPTVLPQHRRYLLALVVVVTGLHWAAWIGVNASADRHLARMRTLNSQLLLSKGTQLSYDEALANFFFDSGRYADARLYYEDFLQIDSGNPRIIGNIADVYRHLGEKEKYFQKLLRAVALNSTDAGVYSNLGVEYAERGDTAAAIAYNKKAIEISPTMEKAYANLGILYCREGDFATADRYFTTALSFGMRDGILFRYAGDACLMIRDYRRAVQNYDAYLEIVPNDKTVRGLRERILSSLRSSRPSPTH